VLSEFKAVQQFVGSRTFGNLQQGLDIMERVPEFQTLSAARKSNLRKAFRLFVECDEFRKSKPSQSGFRKNKLSRGLTRSGDALTI